jgi:hypothetical protein
LHAILLAAYLNKTSIHSKIWFRSSICSFSPISMTISVRQTDTTS